MNDVPPTQFVGKMNSVSRAHLGGRVRSELPVWWASALLGCFLSNAPGRGTCFRSRHSGNKTLARWQDLETHRETSSRRDAGYTRSCGLHANAQFRKAESFITGFRADQRISCRHMRTGMHRRVDELLGNRLPVSAVAMQV